MRCCYRSCGLCVHMFSCMCWSYNDEILCRHCHVLLPWLLILPPIASNEYAQSSGPYEKLILTNSNQELLRRTRSGRTAAFSSEVTHSYRNIYRGDIQAELRAENIVGKITSVNQRLEAADALTYLPHSTERKEIETSDSSSSFSNQFVDHKNSFQTTNFTQVNFSI